MQKLYPEWRSLVIHESSPMMRGAILKLFNECPRLMQSQYYTDEQSRKSIPHGIYQDLQHLTFEDESIDIHITQDVMEHVLNPEKDFKEIARTLRPCGAHIFTVPLVNKNKPSMRRVKINDNGEIEHLQPPIYHGNPVDEHGSLVITDWGYDIIFKIFEESGIMTKRIDIKDIGTGIFAEYIDVLVTRKK